MDEWAAARPHRRRVVKRRTEPTPREVRRLIQLGICVGIFLLLFLGKGGFPDTIASVREDVLYIISTGTDFKAAFSDLGESIRAGEPVFGVIGDFWGRMMGAAPAAEETAMLEPPGAAVPEEPAEPSASPGSAQDVEPEPTADAEPEPDAETEPIAAPEPDAETEPEPEPSQHAQNGAVMPANATADYVTLGLDNTITPVAGVLSSAYGYRDHPIDGGEKFHYGVDIYAEKGSEILAFADGEVDFIGESPVYGLYIQIKHANHVTSFYAHCDTLLLGKGKTVTAGQAIATVGETGNVTGPHLHLEIRKDNVFCDPSYYIKLQ